MSGLSVRLRSAKKEYIHRGSSPEATAARWALRAHMGHEGRSLWLERRFANATRYTLRERTHDTHFHSKFSWATRSTPTVPLARRSDAPRRPPSLVAR